MFVAFRSESGDGFEGGDAGWSQIVPDDLKVLRFFQIAVQDKQAGGVLFRIEGGRDVEIRYVSETRGRQNL